MNKTGQKTNKNNSSINNRTSNKTEVTTSSCMETNLTPPICSETHPATFNFASILAAAIPCPLPLKRFWQEKKDDMLRSSSEKLRSTAVPFFSTISQMYLHSGFALGNKLFKPLLVSELNFLKNTINLQNQNMRRYVVQSATTNLCVSHILQTLDELREHLLTKNISNANKMISTFLFPDDFLNLYMHVSKQIVKYQVK